ncbi:hypothetical protein NLG97_g2609 [Lecanicillium saksenae]|uniref:Uncharacterized protein n=1 Tax=Lecanicillium saksenae TaxID=468837 RepID=A0ACC1R1P0_9HYPO|nr:hypothetical protein NLG97_g2609 [Lecanicillium saksenae]
MTLSNKPEYHIVVLGGCGVGKSCLISRLLGSNFFNEYDPTIEGPFYAIINGLLSCSSHLLSRSINTKIAPNPDSYRLQCVIDNAGALLDILDSGGQVEYDTIQNQHIMRGEAFLLVYSVTSRQSFKLITTLREQILRGKENSNIPVVIVGNKCDLRNEREVAAKEGEALARVFGYSFIETSAKTRCNVERAFYDTVREMRSQRKSRRTSVSSSSSNTVSTTKQPMASEEPGADAIYCSICTIM